MTKTKSSTSFSPSLSFLEQTSVIPSTREDYQHRMSKFTTWCGENLLDWKSLSELDSVIVIYFDECFFHGQSGQEGSKTLAALKFYVPLVSRMGSYHLPRAHRAVKSWLKVDPGQQRLPLPLPITLAICAWMVEHHLAWEAFAILLAFRAYLRPGENAKLKVKSLVAPVTSTGAYSMWALDLHPQCDGKPGKTGNYNETILLDTDAWMSPWFAKLKGHRHGDLPLWPLDPHHLICKFHQACRALQLGPLAPTLYSLRHGGASDDLLQQRRTPEGVLRRGRWRSTTSLKRYAKEAKVGAQLGLVNHRVVVLCQKVEKDIGSLFNRSTIFPIPML